MIICSCAGVTDRQARDAIDAGASSVEELSRKLRGAGADCGACRASLGDLLDPGARERQMGNQPRRTAPDGA